MEQLTPGTAGTASIPVTAPGGHTSVGGKTVATIYLSFPETTTTGGVVAGLHSSLNDGVMSKYMSLGSTCVPKGVCRYEDDNIWSSRSSP